MAYIFIFFACFQFSNEVEISFRVDKRFENCTVFVDDKEVFLNSNSTPLNRRFNVKKGNHTFRLETAALTCVMKRNIQEGQFNPKVVILHPEDSEHIDCNYTCNYTCDYRVREGSFFYRGRVFSGLYCVEHNSIWDNPKDSFFQYVKSL